MSTSISLCFLYIPNFLPGCIDISDYLVEITFYGYCAKYIKINIEKKKRRKTFAKGADNSPPHKQTNKQAMS